MRPALCLPLCCLLVGLTIGCGRNEPEVVLYVALDDEFARPIYSAFERLHGIRVRTKTDTEAAKTVGLVNLLLAEHRSGRVRCDVFWNNEILGTLRLKQAGALLPVPIPEGGDIPEQFRAKDETWYGLAARARILLVNTQLVPEEEFPKSVFELAEPRWRGRFAVANPLFGTTATHMVCLFEVLGPERAKEWLQQLWANDPVMLPGNRHVAEAVASGRVAVGLTDTDDALGQLRRDAPVRILFPDQDGLGTLFIPNTVAVLRNAPHQQEAIRLLRHILRPETEVELALGPSGQIPLHESLLEDPRLQDTFAVAEAAQAKSMAVDFERAARRWQEVLEFLSDLSGITQ